MRGTESAGLTCGVEGNRQDAKSAKLRQEDFEIRSDSGGKARERRAFGATGLSRVLRTCAYVAPFHSKLARARSRCLLQHEPPTRTIAESALSEPDERLDSLARAVVDAALEVHRVLGPGFAESVYEEALAVELSRRAIAFERQVPLTVKYKGFCVGEGRVDLLVGGQLIVELKSVEQLAAVHVAQVISYLKAFDRPLGLLITFNVKLLRSGVRRIIRSRR